MCFIALPLPASHGRQAERLRPRSVRRTTLPTVEDTGTAQLVGGSASVRLDPVFAASIDARTGYRVLLTPRGSTRGIFVATTTADGFIVRESHGGRTTVSFDSRILATALG
jgi:hypothetical protein